MSTHRMGAAVFGDTAALLDMELLCLAILVHDLEFLRDHQEWTQSQPFPPGDKFAVGAIIINVKVREQGSDRRGIFPSVAPRIRISSIKLQPVRFYIDLLMFFFLLGLVAYFIPEYEWPLPVY